MRTIQEVGTEILNNEPKSFYVFSGSEYGTSGSSERWSW